MPEVMAALPEAERTAQLRKAVIASTVGSIIAWYSFFLYGTAASLVFSKLYFPLQDARLQKLLALGLPLVGLSPLIGAALFGHFGDRNGRKATLSVTLLCVGLVTFGIVLVPTYSSIGVWGAVCRSEVLKLLAEGVELSLHKLGLNLGDVLCVLRLA
jgi:MFS family permease